MSAVVVKKKPRAKAKLKRRSIFHPAEQARIIREPKQPSALMEFIASLEGELEYREALIEFQNEWCDHPKAHQEVITTFYRPTEQRYEHELRCIDCGILRHRNGRAPNAGSR